MELLNVSVERLLDWNSTFSDLALRASWITGKLFFEKCNVYEGCLTVHLPHEII